MNWKAFIAASISALTLVCPQNGISCGPDLDPQDYFTSFFSHETAGNPRFKPYYYTSLVEFYDDWDDDSTNANEDAIAQEWAAYLKTSTPDASWLVYRSTPEQLKAIEKAFSGGGLPATVGGVEAMKSLVRGKNQAVIDYLLLAKKAQAISDFDPWSDRPQPDSGQVNNYIREADQGWRTAPDPFIRHKYGFQRCKLAFYNRRYTDCIRWYDEAFAGVTGAQVQPLALGYKAGSLYALGHRREAAFAFTQSFAQTGTYRKLDYQGFLFATDRASDSLKPGVLALAKTPREKATVEAMFGLYGEGTAFEHLEAAYRHDPASPLLPILAVREINKLEEAYLSPLLGAERGGKPLYYGWSEHEEEAVKTHRPWLTSTRQVLEKIAFDGAVPNRALYGAGAAYIAFMARDYPKAQDLLSATRKLNPDATLNDQLQLIQLLLLTNDQRTLTAEREAQLLATVKWLMGKAGSNEEYRVFARNFFSEVLAQRYHQQGEVHKEAIALGVADYVVAGQKVEPDAYSTGIHFLHDNMSTAQVEQLFALVDKKAPTPWEAFLLQSSLIRRDHVIEMMGTVYLRDNNWAKSIEWLKKAGKLPPLIEETYNWKTDKSKVTNVDPFYDYLNDGQRYDKAAPKPYTKLTLAQKLLELETKGDTIRNADARSRNYYQLATGLYNMSHYGNAYQAVVFYRSSVDWNEGSYDLPWKKEYYGVHRARSYYQKAYDAATNKEFKAACLFMIAKCAQRQIIRPSYEGGDYEAWEKEEAAFQKKFRENELFPRFVKEFGTTKFYQYAYNRCSYLRDFVKRTRK